MTVLSSLVMIALLANAQNSGTSRLLPAAGAFLVVTLNTTLSVFFLPLFFFLSLIEKSGKGSWKFPSFALFLSAFGLGILIRWLDSPGNLVAGYANILQPLLSSRWLSNGLWIAVVSLMITTYRPWCSLAWPHRFGLTTPRGVAGLAWAVILFFANFYSWFLPGQDVFGQYLLWNAGSLFFLTALFFAVSSSKHKSILWILTALISLLGNWAMVHPRENKFGPIMQHIGTADLLLIQADEFQWGDYWIPLDLAHLGHVQTCDNTAMLNSRLADHETLLNHNAIWVLQSGESEFPWLKPLSRTPLVLHSFEAHLFPRPITIFSKNGVHGTTKAVDGLYQDRVWSNERPSFVFSLPLKSIEIMEITLKGWRPENAGALSPGLAAILNGTPLVLLPIQKTLITFQVPPGILHNENNTLEIICPTFVPREINPESSDGRNLGLDFHSIVLR